MPDLFERELRVLLDDADVEVAARGDPRGRRLHKRTLIARVIERLAEPALTDDVIAVLTAIGDRSSARCAIT